MIQYATAQIGAILVTINPAYRTEELEYVLNQSSIVLVLSAKSFKTSDYAGMLAAVGGRCPHLRDVVIIGLSGWSAIAGTEADAGALRDVQAGLRSSDAINIQYTSGTTGFPKGATLTHANILNNGYLVGECLEYTDADRVCIPVLFYHYLAPLSTQSRPSRGGWSCLVRAQQHCAQQGSRGWSRAGKRGRRAVPSSNSSNAVSVLASHSLRTQRSRRRNQGVHRSLQRSAQCRHPRGRTPRAPVTTGRYCRNDPVCGFMIR